MVKDFIGTLNEYEGKSSFRLKRTMGVLAAIVLLVMVVISATGCTQNNMADTEIVVQPQEELPKEDVKVGNDGVNGAIAPDEISIVSDQSGMLDTGAMVAMSVGDMGRSDPFLPDHEVTAPKPKYDFELLPPPESITVDTTATDVMSTKVSGIMYDRFNPSAILNISGSDYLVRTGDIINSYKVLSIGREHVTVQNGANVYKAGVGELFTGEGVNFNTISNLENKFGGNKNSAKK